ncbi:hypothetical protein Sango_2435100 [Sesamum angolense]|uniref:DUF4218 domain-containing protein n=1 Tax=Sesamum angolense TaxID=2727404 RepID=A0AAE1W7L9_9LAMI|nr:hypothetical protein Sango_2435100 [Sesamum angolense]
MYNKNLLGRAGLTPEFEDGVKIFIEWSRELIEAPSVPQVSEESTPAGHVEGVLDDGTRSCPVDPGPSSYCYSSGGPYDYDESGLADHFFNRLYSTRATVEHMTWHATHQKDERSMCDPSDADAWKHFDRMYPDGFTSHKLLQLWHVGVGTYEHATNRAFMMRTALMWTVNDLPAYGMAYGGEPRMLWDVRSVWMIQGHSICSMNHVENKVARLRLSRDQILDRVINISPAIEMPLSLLDGYGSDHKWTKKNIFRDLPYWSTLLIQHNLDVMHIEKNMFDDIFNTVMGIKGKMKDNMNARRDLKIIYNRPELELDKRKLNVMPKAIYTLGKEQKRRIAIREMFTEHVWSGLIEVSLLFQSTYSTTLDVHKLHELENSIASIMCNLEKIFLPAFFDSMEHLIVHLPYEPHVGRPVQYRWMYPFERFLCELKKVKNKEHVEASIVEVYIVQIIGTFTSQYFESDVHSKRSMPRVNEQ